MSTRATYTFESKTWDKKHKEHHVYIHYDGYPEGAAEYFAAMVLLENKRGGHICQFIRANDLAEFTEDPNQHGDTEYHYTLCSDALIVAFKINFETRRRVMFFSSSLYEFLNTYYRKDDATRPEFCYYGNQTTTKKAVIDKMNDLLAKSLSWQAEGHVGNAASCLDEAVRINAFLGNKPTKTMLFLSEQFAKAYGHDKTGEQWISEICLHK